jgi:hypothetical protein
MTIPLDPADDWRDYGACRGVDPELFFTEGKGVAAQVQQAQAICWGCPVRIQCGEYAIRAGEYWGVWGGMTQTQLRELRHRKEQRSDLRRGTGTESPAGRAENAAAPRKSYTSLRDLFDSNTKQVIYGHLAWTGPAKPSYKGRTYNPKQVAFILDRGREPVGRVLTTCSVSGCVQPSHIADDEERMRCGSRPGYQRHLNDGEKPCDLCRQANTDADNRLRRTGTTRAAA